jgi:hypothetical protein
MMLRAFRRLLKMIDLQPSHHSAQGRKYAARGRRRRRVQAGVEPMESRVTLSGSPLVAPGLAITNPGHGDQVTLGATNHDRQDLHGASAAKIPKGIGAANAIAKGRQSVQRDWFSRHMSDPRLQTLARTDFMRDGRLTYGDVLALFDLAESEGSLKTATLRSLSALATTGGAAAVNMASSVENLTYKIVDGDPANAQFSRASSRKLKVGSSAELLSELVNKWFLGGDNPTIDTQFLPGSSVGYAPANGTLFGPGGPSYKDVYQGSEGDCWLLASFAETAALDPATIESMFTDDGTAIENGIAVHVWTVRFYQKGAASYVTVDNQLPAQNGEFVYANHSQSINSASNVLWVPLLEKAYAQLSQSGWNAQSPGNAYASLDGGFARTSLPVITGRPESASSPLESASALMSAINAGTLLTLATASTDGGSGSNAAGILGDHDYAVIGYDASNQTFTLMNPWGWNNTHAPGMLNLTWDQIQANFYLDGDCVPTSAVAS